MKCFKHHLKRVLFITSLAGAIDVLVHKIKLRKQEQVLEDMAYDYLDDEVDMYEQKHIKVYSEEVDKQRETIKIKLIASILLFLVALCIPCAKNKDDTNID